MKHTLLSLALLFSWTLAQAKSEARPEPHPFHRFSIGLGLGLDYGGIGTRMTFSPIKSVFVFGGVGYNTIGAGYNVGAGFRLLPEKRFSPYVVGMYGYNTVVTVQEATTNKRISELDRVFYGPTIGVGAELRRSQGRKNFWNFAILVPLRSEEFRDYKAELERKYHGETTMLPFAITVGFNIEI